MIGSQFKHRKTGVLWKIVATDGTAWIMTPVAFGPNELVPVDRLRKDFVKSAEAPAPAPVDLDTEQAGWNALSAEATFIALSQAANAGDLQEGDVLQRPGVSGAPVDVTEPLTAEDVSRIKRYAAKLKPGKTPEDTFAHEARDEIAEAAARVTGSPELLASYEVGSLEVGPQVEKLIDRWIRQRNAREDRALYGNAHVFDRTGR